MDCAWWWLDEDQADALILDDAADAASLFLIVCFAGPPVDFVVEVVPTAAAAFEVRLMIGTTLPVVFWEQAK